MTMSPATPVPDMTGSVVVVSVLPLTGLVIVGAGGAVGTLTVNVSVAAGELGPPEAACGRRSADNCRWRAGPSA